MSKNLKGNWTKVSPGNIEGSSVKTSIPTYLAATLHIVSGDTLEWNHDSATGVMTVRKITPQEIEAESKKELDAESKPAKRGRKKKE